MIQAQSPRAIVQVVCIALGVDTQLSRPSPLQVLLIRCESSPADSSWALPVGEVASDESLEASALRHLTQFGVSVRCLEQVGATYTSDGDGERTISIAYCGLVSWVIHPSSAWMASTPRYPTTNASGWFPIGHLPVVAPHHQDLVFQAVTRVRENTRRIPIGLGLPAAHSVGADIFELLPPRFSLTQLQQLCETIEGTSFDKRNFRKKALASGLLVETEEVEQGVWHRAAKLYRFDRRKYERLIRHRSIESS